MATSLSGGAESLWGMPIPSAVAVVTVIAGLVTGLITLLFGTLFTKKREEAKRQLEFKERQLHGLYAPLWGLRREILALSNFRLRVEQESLRQADEHMAPIARRPDIAARVAGRKNVDQIVEEYVGKVTRYDNEQLAQELLPKYRQMQDVFRENMHLADPDTLPLFDNLVYYNEHWQRSMKDAIPGLVGLKLPVKERDILYPLYDHIDQKVWDLSRELRGLKPAPREASRLHSLYWNWPQDPEAESYE